MEISKLKELVKKSLSDLKQLCRQFEIKVKGRKKATYAEALINNEYYCLESTILAGENTCEAWYSILRMKSHQVEEYALKFNIVRRVTRNATGIVKEHLTKFKSRVYKHMKWLTNFAQPFTEYSDLTVGYSGCRNIFDIETKGLAAYNYILGMFDRLLFAIQVGHLDEMLEEYDSYNSYEVMFGTPEYSILHSWLIHHLDAGLFISTLLGLGTQLSDLWNNQVQPSLFNYNCAAKVTINYTPAQLNAIAASSPYSGEDLPW